MKRIGIAVISAAAVIVAACLAPIGGSNESGKFSTGRLETLSTPDKFLNALEDPEVATILITDSSLSLELSEDLAINGNKTILGRNGYNILNTNGKRLMVNADVTFDAMQIIADSPDGPAIIVEAGKTLALKSAASLRLTDGSGGAILHDNAKITVESNSVITDDDQLWGEGGSLEIKASGKRISNIVVGGDDTADFEPTGSGSIVFTQTSFAIHGTVTMKSSRNLETDEALIVSNGANLTVKSGVELTLDTGAFVNLAGTITIESGGTISDKAEGGGQIWNGGGGGSLIIKHGGIGKRGPQEDIFVGDNNAPLHLASAGSFLKLTKNSYTIGGTVNMSTAVEMGSDITLNIPGGSELNITAGGNLVLSSGASVNLMGNITVENGGMITDEAASGGQIWRNNGSGSITLKSGGTGKVGGFTIVGNDGSAPLQLGSSSSFTLKKDTYTVSSGELTINGAFSLAEGYSLTVGDASTLNIASGATLQIDEGRLEGVSNSSKLIIVSGGSVAVSGSFPFVLPAGTYTWNGSGWQ